MKRNVHQKECLYQKIYREILNDIENHVLTVGQRIPTEMELAEKYGVSRITSKKATDILDANGYIIKYPGRGSFVCERTDKALIPVEVAPGRTAAKNLVIGVVLYMLMDSFGSEVISGIEEACRANGASLVLKLIHNDVERETESINELLQMNVSGILLMVGCFATYNQKILELSVEHFPLVFIDRYLPGLAIPCVSTDHNQACKELTDAMFNHGHKALMLAMCDKAAIMTSVVDRINGYIASCMEHNEMSSMNRLSLEGDIGMAIPEDKYEQSVDTVCDYLTSHPDITGAIALSDGVAIVLCAATERMRLRLHRRIEVACFDATLRKNPYPHPMFSIDQDQRAIGNMAMQTLLKSI
ncbi:MAG: GntR family transcriptional regulator, partial [Acinetobacter sp.]